MRHPIVATIVASSSVLLVSLSGAFGPQSTHQQACLNKLNKDGAAVAKEQGKASFGCLKNAGTGKLVGTAQSCLTADARGNVQKKQSKTTADAAKSCGTPPDFGYTSAATINGAAVQGELDLITDIFGGNLDAAVLSCTPNKAPCRCQQTVLGAVQKLVDAKFAEFVKCKKAALHHGATTVAALNACVNDAGAAGSIAADTKGQIQKTVDKLNAAIVKRCDKPGIGGAFPGDCAGMTGGALGSCLDVQVECRVCQMMNESDGLFINCDVFDDHIANGSCVSGTGPTPTPTFTAPPPTPTATATFVPGLTFQGALTQTTGRFTYNLTIGTAGSDAACNTQFPGSHTCTYAELQTADAANELVLANDGTNLVTAFWAIDAGQTGIRQCYDDLQNTFTYWAYQTAHTASRGDRVPLTGGHLGALQPSQTCSTSSWVGCCL